MYATATALQATIRRRHRPKNRSQENSPTGGDSRSSRPCGTRWRRIIRVNIHAVLRSLLPSSGATSILPIWNGLMSWRRRGRRKPPGVVYKGASVHIPHRHTKCTKVIEQSSSMDMRCSRIHIGEKELVPSEMPINRLTSRTTMTPCSFSFAGDSTNSGT